MRLFETGIPDKLFKEGLPKVDDEVIDFNFITYWSSPGFKSA